MQEDGLSDGGDRYPLYEIRGCWTPWECEWPYCHCPVHYDSYGRPKPAMSSWKPRNWIIFAALGLLIWAAIIYAAWRLVERIV